MAANVRATLDDVNDFELGGEGNLAFRDPSSGQHAFSITDQLGVQLQGTFVSAVSYDNDTNHIMAFGAEDNATFSGRVGYYFGCSTWNLLSNLDAVYVNTTPTASTINIPVSEQPTLSGYIPLWVAPSITLNAVGYRVTVGNVANNAGENVFVDRVFAIPEGDWPYALSGTCSIAELLTAETNTTTGYYGTLVQSQGIYFFYCGFVIGRDATTGNASDFTFNETGETFAIANLSSLSGTTQTDHSRWTVRMDATNPSFAMTNCNFQASEPDKASRVNEVQLVFQGTNGTATMTNCNLLDLDSLILTSSCEIDGGRVRAVDITQGSADIHDGILVSDTASGVALINDPTTGASSGIYNTTFVQGDAGHALELPNGGPTSYTFSGIKFQGYTGTTGENLTPNSGSTAAAVYNNTGGDVTINIAGGGDSPSIRNGAGSRTFVVNNITIKLTNIENGSEVRVFDSKDTTAPYFTPTEIAGAEDITSGVGTSVTNASVGSEGSPPVNTFTFTVGSGTELYIKVFNTSFIPYLVEVTPTQNTDIKVDQKRDRVQI